MKKIVLILVSLFLIGCTTTQDPTPKEPYKLVRFTEYYYNTTFCRDSLCAQIDSEYIMNFLSSLSGEENTTKPGNEVFRITLSSDNQLELKLSSEIVKVDFIYYDNEIVKVNEIYYKINNLNELKEEFSYLFEFVNQKMKPVREVITDDYKLTEIDWTGLGGTGWNLQFKDEVYAKQFAELFRDLYYLDSGFPIYAAGGGEPTVKFESNKDVITMSDENGFYLVKNEERITIGKESVAFGIKPFNQIVEEGTPVKFSYEIIPDFWTELTSYEDDHVSISSYSANQDYYRELSLSEIEAIDIEALSEYTITYNNKKITKFPFEEDKEFIIYFTKEDSNTKVVYLLLFKGIPPRK